MIEVVIEEAVLMALLRGFYEDERASRVFRFVTLFGPNGSSGIGDWVEWLEVEHGARIVSEGWETTIRLEFGGSESATRFLLSWA